MEIWVTGEKHLGKLGGLQDDLEAVGVQVFSSGTAHKASGGINKMKTLKHLQDLKQIVIRR